MIYTSYYSKMDKIKESETLVPVAISASVPVWAGPVMKYKKLAPSYELLNDYKNGKISWEEYEERYKAEVLSELDQKEVAAELAELVNGAGDPALMCWEKTRCHREIVAKWLNDAGIACEEAKF